MAELEVDQSNLPKVQEVCQGFAVLEDGALAHNLQEQEIEQFYSSNVQRNQLVQRDIREAKRLQDEEKQKVLMHQPQTTQQLEKLDSEYAQMIQEEIRRCAEEARRRELEDEEIAKRIQEEEEELCVRHRTTHQTQHGRDSSSVPAPPYSPRAAQTHHTEIHYQPPTRRWQHSLPSYSDIEENPSENRPGRSQSLRDFRPSVGIRRQVSRCSTTPTEEDNRSLVSQDSSRASQRSRSSQLSGGWGDVVRLIKTDMNEQGYLSHSSEDELFEPVYKLERILKQKQQGSRKRPSRHGSVREEPSPTWHGDDGHRERLSERHVRFVDDRRRPVSFDVNSYRIISNELNAGRDGSSVVPSHNFKVQSGQTQGFQRNVSMSRSYHCDTRLSRRPSVREANGTYGPEGSSWANRMRPSSHFPAARMMPEREVNGGNQRQRAQSSAENERSIDGPSFYRERRVRRSQSERRQTFREETRWTPRFPPSSPERSCVGPPPGAGLGVVGESAALDLGQLEQVLLDEELARRLQKEEERFVEESQMDSPRSVYPVGDFRVAQVAQDEEIARFIQKQEIRAKRRSQELDSAGPRQEFREDVCDRRTRGDRQVHRQRLDSEGLQSPTDDFTPDYQAHSPISRATHQQPIRNIAEELDPTFQRNDFPEASQINEANQGQASQKVSSSPIDEPAFIPPTKRQADKVGRAKAKEKKEQFKQKENCKTH